MPWWAIFALMLTPFIPITHRRSFLRYAWCLCQGVGLAVADMIFDGGFDGRDGGFDGGWGGGYDGGWDGGYDGGW